MMDILRRHVARLSEGKLKHAAGRCAFRWYLRFNTQAYEQWKAACKSPQRTRSKRPHFITFSQKFKRSSHCSPVGVWHHFCPRLLEIFLLQEGIIRYHGTGANTWTSCWNGSARWKERTFPVFLLGKVRRKDMAFTRKNDISVEVTLIFCSILFFCQCGVQRTFNGTARLIA